MKLAAIDHNFHTFRKPAFTKSGKQKFNKVYSKRSKIWKVEIIKEDKQYKYWPILANGILDRREKDEQSVHRKIKIPENHPKNIAKSIALKPVPKTSDLVKQSLSRFVSKTGVVPHEESDEELAL